MRVRTLCLVALSVVSSIALGAQGQTDRVQFRTGVELVQLDVVVLDGKRQPVRGLSASDFTVLDNGVETAIRAFTPVELARPRANDAVWASEVPSDVVTNRLGEEEGRLVVILMDRSTPPAEPTVTARKIATAAVESLGPHDLAAIVSTNNSAVQTGAVQNLTADRSRLLRAINSEDRSTGISPEAMGIMNLGWFQNDELNDPRCLCGLCVLETITRVAEAVQSTPRRRKVMFFIGSNIIWQTTRPTANSAQDPGCEVRLKDARTAMFAAIDRANLTVHSIDPRGLVNAAPQAHASSPNKGAASALASLQAGLSSSLTERANLTVLPDRTGGRTVVGRNNPEQTVAEIFGESDAYYVIGIERGVSSRPDNARTIEVKARRKGLHVVAQRQYAGSTVQPSASTAPTTSAAATTVDGALNQLLPAAGTPLSLAVTAFASPDNAKPIVRINVDAGAFARGDGAAVALDVTVLAVDRTGKAVASARQTSTISARRSSDVTVQSHLELPPGEYGIRVAVADAAAGRVGSVFSDVTVPKFNEAELSLSDISVEAASSSSASSEPTTRRVFKRTEQVRAVLQIYQGTQRTDALVPIAMRVQILDAKGSAVRDQALPFTESSFTNRRADCVITLPLAKLAPGAYLLKLDATAHHVANGRALRFIVE